MAKQYTIDIDDLNDTGVLLYASTAIQDTISRFDDWPVIGPLVERFRIELSFHDSPSTKLVSLRGDAVDEPWSASIENSGGRFLQWGSTPGHAISKVLIEAHMKGSEINIPQTQAESLLKYPDEVEQIDLQ